LEYREDKINRTEQEFTVPISSIVGRTLRILVVDDDDKISNLLVHFIKTQGFEVQSVEDGVSALKLIKKRQFDVIFTDWDMYDISGIELARAIRHLNRRVIIYVISGWSRDALSRHTSKKNIDNFIKKPFLFEEILEALEWAKKELLRRDEQSQAKN